MKTNVLTFSLMFIIVFESNLYASYPEFFGASYSTTSVGNQTNLEANDPSNNYYIPALMGFSKKVNMLIQATSTTTNFKPMTNIVVANNTNSASAEVRGNVANDYQSFQGASLHLNTPIGYDHLGTIGLSVYMPLGHLIETNSGDPFKPEYVMYHSRYQRTNIYLNFARIWDSTLAWSLGTHVGYQANADIKMNLSLGAGANYGSYASSRAKVAPSLGVIASILKIDGSNKYYFTYQQEMKSNLHAGVSGGVNEPLSLLFDSSIDSMIFYDPHTFRFGMGVDLGAIEFFGGAEYQMWSNYKPPVITIAKTGGVIFSSTNYERITIQDTINPRVGMKVNLTDRWSTGLGLAYRMSPLKGDFSGNGNSIDSNTYIFSTGLQYRIVIWSKDVNVGTSIQYQQLESRHVEKTAGQENGAAGNKIGAGGYDIDGNIIAASFGIKFNF